MNTSSFSVGFLVGGLLIGAILFFGPIAQMNAELIGYKKYYNDRDAYSGGIPVVDCTSKTDAECKKLSDELEAGKPINN